MTHKHSIKFNKQLYLLFNKYGSSKNINENGNIWVVQFEQYHWMAQVIFLYGCYSLSTEPLGLIEGMTV